MRLFKDEDYNIHTGYFVLTTIGRLFLIVGAVLLIAAFLQRWLQAGDEQKIREIAAGPQKVTTTATNAAQNQPDDPQGAMQYVKKTHKDRSLLGQDIKDASGAGDWKQGNPLTRAIDFDALHEVNPDIIGWIYLPGTKIDYPILCATEDEGEDFYIDRNYAKRSSTHGSIFIQTGKKSDFSVYDTVIYGHNMMDGTMFQGLYELKDEDSKARGNTLYIYTPGRIVRGKLLACYVTSRELITAKYNRFLTEADRKDYINSFGGVTEQYNSYKNRLIKGEENLITLSTCSNRGNDRLLAQFMVVSE